MDWHVYNLIKDDDALLDFIVSYGRPFPLLDSSGQEVSTERDSQLPEFFFVVVIQLPQTPDDDVRSAGVSRGGQTS